MTQFHSLTRREFVRSAAVAGTVTGLAPWRTLSALGAEPSGPPIKVAAILTTFTHRSHAHVILENFLQPYLFNGQVTQPGMQVTSMFVDQVGADDMSREVGQKFGIKIYPTIGEALCLGADQLAVDAVLSIAEHGQYPVNAKAQMQYPRKQFYDQIVEVFRKSGRGVPVFNDKHLSYRWDWAKEMYDTSHELKFPLMAGSSVPLAERRPPLELPPEARIASAVSIHGGGVESYDIHCLEVLQSLVEARAGGETGVRAVQFLEAEPLWQAAASGQWSPELAAAAMAAEVGPEHELTKFIASSGTAKTSEPVPVHGILVHYRDGLTALALKVGIEQHSLELCLPVAGRERAACNRVLRGPLAEPQPVQSPVARHSNALPRKEVALSAGTDTADHRHSRRGHGLARGRRQNAADAAARHQVRRAGLSRHARDGRLVEDHHRGNARAGGHCARGHPAGVVKRVRNSVCHGWR